VLPIKKRIVVTPTISNISVMQVPASPSQNSTTQTTRTCVTVQESIQNNKSAVNSLVHSAEGNTILIDNKQYKLVKEPSGPTRAVSTPTNSNCPSLQITESWSKAATSTSGQTREVDNDTYVLHTQPSTDTIKVCKVHHISIYFFTNYYQYLFL